MLTYFEVHRKEITHSAQSLDLFVQSNSCTIDISVQRAYCAGRAPLVFPPPLLLVVDYTCHSSQNPLSHVSFINSVLEARGYYLCIIIPSLTLARAGPPCTEWNYFLKVYIYIYCIYILYIYCIYDQYSYFNYLVWPYIIHLVFIDEMLSVVMCDKLYI